MPVKFWLLFMHSNQDWMLLDSLCALIKTRVIRFSTRWLMATINCLLVYRLIYSIQPAIYGLLEDLQNKYTHPVAISVSSLGKHQNNLVRQVYFCDSNSHPEAPGLCSITVIMWNVNVLFLEVLVVARITRCKVLLRCYQSK